MKIYTCGIYYTEVKLALQSQAKLSKVFFAIPQYLWACILLGFILRNSVQECSWCITINSKLIGQASLDLGTYLYFSLFSLDPGILEVMKDPR